MPNNKTASFVENVNTVANATRLATGDVIEDAQLARDEAKAAAEAARLSSINASGDERLAHEWANKAFNSPVGGTNEFSSYHWSVIASQNAGDQVIQDGLTSVNYTWSSSKVQSKLDTKADVVHNHDGVYEPAIIKNSAFNKNYGGSGTADYVAHSDHDHSNVYEPVIGAKGTAFNKDFGLASNNVSRGDHNHDAQYMPKVFPNTAYNKNFGIVSGTVSEGNHIHPAEKISYDNNNNNIITSATVQGAINQLDSQIGIFSISENSYMTAGYSVQTEISIAGADTPVKVTVPLAILDSKNATLNNGSSIDVLISPQPEKLIEGLITITMTLSSTDTTALYIAIDDTIHGERVVSNKGVLTISKYITRLPVDGFTISAYIANLENTNNIFVESMNITWEGQPQGALVASGIVVDHADLTGTGAANGVHTTSDIQDLDAQLLAKADKLPTANENNLAAFDGSGNLKDSGHTIVELSNKANKVPGATADRIAILTSSGDLAQGTNLISDLALKNGSAANKFKVANSSAADEATSRGEVDGLLSNYATSTELTSHLNATNPHSITPTSIGAANSSHTHTYSDIPGLSDELTNKYTIVPNQPTDNIPIFGDNAGSPILKDSGKSLSDFIIDGESAEEIIVGDQYAGRDFYTLTSNIDGGSTMLILDKDGSDLSSNAIRVTSHTLYTSSSSYTSAVFTKGSNGVWTVVTPTVGDSNIGKFIVHPTLNVPAVLNTHANMYSFSITVEAIKGGAKQYSPSIWGADGLCPAVPVADTDIARMAQVNTKMPITGGNFDGNISVKGFLSILSDGNRLLEFQDSAGRREGLLYSNSSNGSMEIRTATAGVTNSYVILSKEGRLRITGSATLAVDSQDLTTKLYVDTALSGAVDGKVNKSGDTMTGGLAISKNAAAITLTATDTNYIVGNATDGSLGWYLGKGNSSKNSVRFNNYKGTYLELTDDGKATIGSEEIVTKPAGTGTGTDYTKMPDGTLICWGRQSATGYDMAGSNYVTISFPVAFKFIPSVTVTIQRAVNDSVEMFARMGTILTTTQFNCAHNATNTHGGTFNWQAIGRWK